MPDTDSPLRGSSDICLIASAIFKLARVGHVSGCGAVILVFAFVSAGHLLHPCLPNRSTPCDPRERDAGAARPPGREETTGSRDMRVRSAGVLALGARTLVALPPTNMRTRRDTALANATRVPSSSRCHGS